MSNERSGRRLAAILAGDIAGYSRLMGVDEEGTLRQLKLHRKQLVDLKIREHRGRIVKTTGDGILVTFSSAVDAVHCAVEIQKGMAERNVLVPSEKRIEFRIGINVGDIIVEERDIFGDGVNVAARIESVADAASFSAAAAELGISQPSLSETIKRVEEELGARLFERTTRSLSPTPEGEHAVAVAREAVRDFRLALESIADRTQGRRGRLTVAALPSVACAVLPSAIQAFRSRYPGIEVRIHDVLHERAVDMVLDGVADLALSVRPPERPELKFHELGGDGLHLVCGADHPLARRRQVRWRDLGPFPFIALARTSSVRRLTDAAFTHCDLSPEPAFTVEQIPSAAALVEAGLGVTALTALTLSMFRGQTLTTRPLKAPEIRRSVGVITLDGRAPTPPAKELLAQFAEGFRRATGAYR